MGFKHFNFFALRAGLGLILVVHAQDQSGFISIACGAPANSSFTEDTTGINYISDATFIDSGVSKSVSADIKATHQQQVWNLRSFPQGNRNCYTINVTASTKYLIRATFMYPYNVHDRLWMPLDSSFLNWTDIRTSLTIDSKIESVYQLPSVVMSTAATPINEGAPIEFSWDNSEDAATAEYYIYMHFAEIVKLRANQSRSFNITLNGNFWYGPLVPDYLSTISLSHIYLNEWIDACEILGDAMAKFKPTFGIKRNWQGDPCAPKAYSWEGLNCSYDGYSPPRITSLNLSSSGLVGEISTDISNLVMLQYLDLSNNNLTGPVPDLLSQLQHLRVFVGDNPNLCGSRSCKKKKNNFVVPIVASLGGLLILSLIVAAFLLGLRRRKHQDETTVVQGDTKSNIQNATSSKPIQGQFTYSELLKITNNFERILGKGGIGIVYHGNVDDCQVAVHEDTHSICSKLLMRLHHRNLTSLVGYCCEGTNMGLIYEYMAYRDLKAHLSGEKANILNWEERLRIAMDAAQGLEYLHHGCKPPIIHGDVKSTNILLTENLCAKLSDFSLSKIFLNDDGTYASTSVGTPEDQDPE
ncbi:hypothetical protein FH972_003621 [Carpinus fangiana]|uniref:non-specific serine/threonine protein kinase n=1 Tax=Carpinus fangiana TaxID=176857 RepID=A0A5N6QLA1_9ROSI|nr:hypothetical protein FH972_003621 [Carpinus fangiana]